MFNSKNSNNDDLFQMILVFGGLLVAGFVLPVLLLSVVGAYFLYWGWHIELEQGVVRRGFKTLTIYLTVVVFSGLVCLTVLHFFGDELLRLNNAYRKNHILNIDELRVLLTKYTLYGSALLSPLLVVIASYFKTKSSPRLYFEAERVLRVLALPIFMVYGLAWNLFSILAVFIPPFLGMAVFYFTVDLFGEGLAQGMVANFASFSFLLWNIYGAIWAFRDPDYTRNYPNFIGINENQKNGLVIGRLENRRSLSLDWHDLNHHIHILGQPGAGKSTLLKNFYAHSILNGLGFMMLDLKADLDVRSEILLLSKQADRVGDLKVLDFSNPTQSVGYNPLLRGNPSELKDRIIESFEWSETYYKKVAERFVLNVMRGLVVVRDELELTPTLSDLLEVVSYPESLKILAEKLPGGHQEVKEDLLDLSVEFKKGTFRESLSGLRADLEALLKSEFGEILVSSNSVDLYEIIKLGEIFYVLLDGQTYPVQALRIGRMLLSDLRSASGRIVSQISKEQRPKFSVIVDEFSDLVSTKEMGRQFTGFLNRCRGSGIGVVIAHQSLGDFEDPQVARQVIDSTNTVISFVQKDPESCEVLAGIAGTREFWEKTEQTDRFFVFGDSETGRGSRVKGQEYIYHPNDFKNLDIGEAIYLAKKPSRHGRVFVRNFQIETNHNLDYERPPKSQLELLNLKKDRRTHYTLKSESVKVSPTENEIPLDYLT